jgi:four helix bundle protein
MMPFERFKAWRLAHRLALDVYQESSRWPARERYGLVSQARRAAVSIPSNIAEGTAKRGEREFGRHLDIALGSLSD